MAHSSFPIPATESYWILVDKADKKFSKIRDLPYYERNRYVASFSKVFKVYTQLWKFQQDNRQKLVEAGLKRWQIGEIASRIGQLYFGQYMRTSDASFLSESYIFYEAILSREYFKEGLLDDINVAYKQLRFLARFLTVCLVLDRREFMHLLFSQFKALVDDCTKSFQGSDFREWKVAVQEIIRFLKADTEFMNIRPLRYSHVLDSHPDYPSHVAFREERNLKLRDAVLCSYHPNEVKFSELTIDTFRMLQCLEWEPSGSLYSSHVPAISGNSEGTDRKGTISVSHVNYSQKISDLALPPNPRKAILYRPSPTHLVAVLAMTCEELPSDGILLIYLSDSGRGGKTTTNTINNDANKSALRFFQTDITHCNISGTSFGSSTDSSNQNLDHLHVAPGYGGLSCIFPSDIIPFTRRPLFLVIDSNSTRAFETISGAEKGERTAMLLSSTCLPPTGTLSDFSDYQRGSVFTMFLTVPLQAFCFLLGFSDSGVNMALYNEADKVLSTSLADWGSVLAASYTLDAVWVQISGDPFLRRLLLRFIFCRAVLAHYALTCNNDECLPRCIPDLPESFLPTSSMCRAIVVQLAAIFGASNSFKFT